MDDEEDNKPIIPKTPEEIDQEVYRRTCSVPKGITQGRLLELIPSISIDELALSISKLLTAGKINYFLDEELQTNKYFARTEEQAAKFQGLGQEEMTLYQLIKAEGRMGIWQSNLRVRSGLTLVRLRRILQTLENRKLIKEIKSIRAKTKKMYMLSELEPDPSHLGGPWYQDGAFDSVFFKVLSDFCYRAICKAGTPMTAEDLCLKIKQSNISRVELSLDHVCTIVNTLVYDGLVDEVGEHKRKRSMIETTTIAYKPSRLTLPPNELTNVPCGTCPVSHLCSTTGDITPEKCIYLEEWLSF